MDSKKNNRQNNREDRAADVNRLIYKFLHPILKFAGESQLLYQMGKHLRESLLPGIEDFADARETGRELLTKLTGIRDNLARMDRRAFDDEMEFSRVKDLRNEFTKIVNVYHHSLHTETSSALLDVKTRDTALWVFEELNKINYTENEQLKNIVGEDFIRFLQGILFHHLLRGARLMASETYMLEREVEALRPHVGVKMQRRYSFARGDIGKILERNLELFEPLFSGKGIEIDYKHRGSLTAEISAADIDRMICNLLHNVNVYSYGGERRFVKVRARELQPEDEVEISIQSFGTPIKKEEIGSGSLFKFGCRGQFAYEHYRDGTGVGLTDAREVVDAHNGKITIDSIPRADDGDPPQYKIPYLTTVTIHIPKKRKE